MNLTANATGANGAAGADDASGNPGGDGLIYNTPAEVVTIPGGLSASGGSGSGGGADAENIGGFAGGDGGDGVNFNGQNGSSFTSGNYTGLVNDGVIRGGNGGSGSASGAATNGAVSGGNGGDGGSGLGAAANFSEISGTGSVTGGAGGAGGDGGTSGDKGGSGGFGGDGIVISNNDTELNSMGAIAGGSGGNGGNGDGTRSGDGGYGGVGILVAATSAVLSVNSNVTGGVGGNGGYGGTGQAGMAGDGGYGIDIDAFGKGAALTIASSATVLGGSTGVNGAAGSGTAAVNGAVNGVGIGVEGTGGTIANHGTVEGGGGGAGVGIGVYASTAQLGNTGHITATTGNSVSVDDYFNYGDVTLSSLDNASGGVISATKGNAVDIAGDLGGGHIGTLTNDGIISATSGNAVLVDDAGSGGATIGTLANASTISATSGVALNIANGGSLGVLENTGGTITSADTEGAGAPDNATVVLNSVDQGALTLNGAISNTAANDAAVALSIHATPGGAITTAGTIRADGAGGANSGDGVAIEFAAAATVDNTGALYGRVIDTGNNADTLNNSGAIYGAINVGGDGTINNTGTITVEAGETVAGAAISGHGTYTFQLTPGSTAVNGTEGQLIANTVDLSGATIQVAPTSGTFVNDSLFEIASGTSPVSGVTSTPADIGAGHGDTSAYKFYEVLGGTTLSPDFGGGVVPGNADDVFIIAVAQSGSTGSGGTTGSGGDGSPVVETATLPHEKLSGGAGDDTLTAGAFVSTAPHSTGGDTLIGLGGDDTLIGGGPGTSCYMYGGAGDDTYVVDLQLTGKSTAAGMADHVVESANQGTDTIILNGTESLPVYSTIYLPVNVENLDASQTGATLLNLVGNKESNILTGNDAGGTLDGGAGGPDTLIGGTGNNTYIVHSPDDVVVSPSGGGNDVVVIDYNNASHAAPVTIDFADYPNVADITIKGTGLFNVTGGAGDNVLTGNGQVNTLTGSGGNDTFLDGTAVDTMIGAGGNDTFTIGNSSDTVLAAGSGNLIVDKAASGTFAMPANADVLTMSGTASISARANDDGDTLTGNIGANTLIGGAGDDTLTGGLGHDVLTGGGGSNSFVFTPAAAVSSNNSDTITDFKPGGGSAGDVIDISDILSGHYSGGSLAGFVHLASDGHGGADILVNASGAGNTFVLIADIARVSVATLVDADTMQANGSLIV